MNAHIKNAGFTRGFTLVQISIILTVAALVMVTVLPGLQTTLNANKVSMDRMNAVLLALREYEASNGLLPCPADASLPMGNAYYGVAGMTIAGDFCFPSLITGSGAEPSANYYDSTNGVAIGMVPVRALGLSNDYALDGYGRYITYAVDVRAANAYGWSVTQPGNILIDDNGVVFNTIVALVSHGADGHGAWLPLNAASGTGTRFNAGSTDTDQHMVNAHGILGGTWAANQSTINSRYSGGDEAGHVVTFVKKPPTNLFDDLVVYKNPLWNINNLPLSILNMATVSPVANGVYLPSQPLNFTVTYPSALQITGGGGMTFNFTVDGLTPSGSGNHSSTSGNAINFFYLSPSNYVPETTNQGIIVSSPMSITMPGTITNTNVIIPTTFNLPNGSGVLNGIGSSTVSSAAGVRVSAPSGIAVDGSGNCSGACIDVVDTFNARVSRWTTGFAYGSTFGTVGTGNSNFTNPSGIAVDATNNMYVVDSGSTAVTGSNNRIVKYTSAGSYSAQFGSWGTTAGTFHNPTGIAIDNQASCNTASTPCLWITDTGNNKIQSCSTNMTGGTTYCQAYGGSLSNPTGIAVDSTPHVYVVDSGHNRIVVFTSTGGITYTPFAGGTAYFFGSVGNGNGNFEYPTGIAIDTSAACTTISGGTNCIWVTDSLNNRVQEFSSAGVWEMTIGGGSTCISGTCTLAPYPTAPSGGSTALCYSNAACAAGNGQLYFNNPTGIFISGSNIFVIDDNNARVQVFTTAGAYVASFGSYGTCSPPTTTTPCFNF